jgi:hypothetical protein
MIATPLAALAVDVDTLHLLDGNPRRGDVGAVARSLARFGQRKPIVAKSDGTVIAGNHTLLAARELHWPQVAVVYVDDDDATAKAFALADNRTAELGGYDDEALAAMIADVRASDAALLAATGWTDDDLTTLLDDLSPRVPSVALADRFLIPPFSVFDARQKYWQDRKARWLSIGLRSGEGRDELLTYGSDNADPVSRKIAAVSGGTSIFDPVLCEVLVRWFSARGARILDPFAGGSVRGIVSALLDRTYVGVDLAADQIVANEDQARVLCAGPSLIGPPCTMPQWFVGDARDIDAMWPDPDPFDLVLTCPPYFDLEVYGDDPADLSRCPDVDAFADAMTSVLTSAAARLHDDRFAVVVMGEARNDDGHLHGLIPATIHAANAAGMAYHNEAILVTAASTAALRAARPFIATRKLTRTHQTILAFVKGDAAAAAAWCGHVEIAHDSP